MRIIFLLSSLLFVFASCSPKLSPDQNWAEGKWILTELKEVPVQTGGNNNRNAHLEFRPSSKTYSGFGGCNKIAGSYTISKGKIKFSSGVAKVAGCPDVPFEETFLALLNEANKYVLNGDVITLKDGNKTVIKLERK